MKILILASNPRSDINLDGEIRLVKDVIQASSNRDEFKIESEPGVRVGDLQGLLLRHKPQIVHFSGHGSGEEGLIFKMDGGGEQSVRADALADMFGLNPICSHVKCVILNACYSETQANAIVSRINYVVGMSQAIQDKAAIAFSKGFYLALGEGCSIDDSFEFGRNAIQLEISGSSKTRSAGTEEGVRQAMVVDVIQQTSIPEHLKPILKYNPALTQASNRAFSVPEQPLSQAKREKIQLDIAKALMEEKPELKQFRDQIREYLQDHQLADHEIVFLDQLREELGLSTEEVDGVLEDEQAPIRQAQRAYEKRLVALIKYYPFSKVIQEELKKFQAQRKLTDEEVNKISRPILEQAEAAHQAKQKQQAQQEYENKLQLYEQEFSQAIAASYPIEPSVCDELKGVQRSSGLSDEDIARIEEPIIAPKEAEYQRQLEQQREQEQQQQRQQEYQEKLQRYKQEFRRAIEARYPLEEGVRDELTTSQRSQGLEAKDVADIERPILEASEAAHQEKIRQEQEHNLQRYEEEFRRVVEAGYPLSDATRNQLKNRQLELGLRDEEVAEIVNPILVVAEAAYQEKLQRYEQEFRTAIAAQYPFDSFLRGGLTVYQQFLELSDEDVARIEEPIVAPKEAAYQEQLAEEQRRKEAEHQLELERQQKVERQRQEQLKQEAAEKQQQAEAQERQWQEAEELKRQQAEAEGLRQEELEQQQVLEQQRREEAQRGQAAQTDNADELASEKGVDYTRLRDLLKARQWEEADQETVQVMLKAAGQEKQGHLETNDIKQFPCTDLRTIDQLWVKHSRGKFGFSVQKKIWQKCGNPTDYTDTDWEKFGEAIGWKRKGFLGLNTDWFFKTELPYSTSEGHFPHLGETYPFCRMGLYGGGGGSSFHYMLLGGEWSASDPSMENGLMGGWWSLLSRGDL